MNIFSDPLSPVRLPIRFLYPPRWCAPQFRGQLEYLNRHPELRSRSNRMTEHAGKEVWRVELPPEAGGGVFAYKLCHGKKPWRYILNLSHPAREWRNYRAIYQLGVPAAEVVAYGEARNGWRLAESFIITRFLEGTRDGCDFMPGGRLRNDGARRRRFCELIAPELARLHRHGFFHKALHPRNILYRGDTPGEMQIYFIDVARCRMRFRSRMRNAILFDLYTPLRDLALPAVESRAFIADYCRSFPGCPFTTDELERRLRAFRRHGESFDVIGS